MTCEQEGKNPSATIIKVVRRRRYDQEIPLAVTFPFSRRHRVNNQGVSLAATAKPPHFMHYVE